MAVIYDSEFGQFLSEHSKSFDDYFDAIQSNPIDRHWRPDPLDYTSYSNGMEDIFNLDFQFYTLQNEWWDDGGNPNAVPSMQDVRDAGQTFLGSSQDWNYDGAQGHTDDYNHGFDILYACTGEGAVNGGGTLWQENWCRISMNDNSDWKYGIIVSLHEFYHLYHILDGGNGPGQSDTPRGYVMNKGELYSGGPSGHSYGNGWFRIDYTNNYQVFNTWKNSYDGPP
ncbi:MAG: hypothetical protein ACFFDI_22775 [Promethearchaeota archaeon]